jgi:aspartyl/asparaginyl beta-hydroxylase (cupin superfamily)
MRKQLNHVLKIDKAYVAVRSLVEYLNIQFSLVGKGPFFHPDVFPWIAELESNWISIRKELDILLKNREEIPNFQDYSVRQRAITQDDKWKTYVLYFHGMKEEENCKKCPETLRLVENIPGMKTAFFSILAPQKHLPKHRGPFKSHRRESSAEFKLAMTLLAGLRVRVWYLMMPISMKFGMIVIVNGSYCLLAS